MSRLLNFWQFLRAKIISRVKLPVIPYMMRVDRCTPYLDGYLGGY